MSHDNLTLIEEMMNNLNTTNINVTNSATRPISLPPHYRYPSGYTPAHIVVASIVATLLMIVVIVGNMLVIIAITTEKSLKNIQNWFIASLAVADFFLGLVIMPFSLANELMGYWTFGTWWCDVHSAMDVLLSTASIMNLCLISLDRYWSITQAVEYLKKRTPRRAAIWIGAVWAAAALVCIPPLLGWKVERREAEQFPQCQLSEEVGYVLYSALGSFYIPSCIMVFVYIRIYYAAKARARRGIRKTPRRPETAVTALDTSFTNLQTKTGGNNNPVVRVDSSAEPRRQIATIEVAPSALAAIPTVTCDLASDISTSDHANDQLIEAGQQALGGKDTLKVVNGDLQQTQSVVLSPPRIRQPSIMEADMVSEFDPSSSDSGVATPQCAKAAVKPSRLRMCRFGRKKTKCAVKVAKETSRAPRDPEREKRRVARKKEKRATLILGLIMGSFIACWLPFFFMYILRLAYTIPPVAFSTAFWLGYMNSALNPVIYTIFNKDFRRAFRRILFK